MSQNVAIRLFDIVTSKVSSSFLFFSDGVKMENDREKIKVSSNKKSRTRRDYWLWMSGKSPMLFCQQTKENN